MPPAISKGNSSALVPPLPTCCTPTILLRSLCPVTLPPLVQPTTPHVVVLPSASETERKEAAAPPTMGSNQDSRRDVMKNRYVETIIRATEKMLESDHKTDPNELEKKIQRLRAQRLRLNRTKAIATVQESRKKTDTSKRKIEIEVLREATRQKLREVEKDARLHPLWPTIPWNTLLELGLVTKSGEHIYFISKPKKKKRSFLSKNEKIIVTETRGEIEQGEIIMMESSDDIEKGEIV